MAQDIPPTQRNDEPRGDPWAAFGYVVAGVLLYGLIGWLLDRWLGTTFLVAIGIIAGAALGIFQTWARFRIPITDPTIDQDDAPK